MRGRGRGVFPVRVGNASGRVYGEPPPYGFMGMLQANGGFNNKDQANGGYSYPNPYMSMPHQNWQQVLQHGPYTHQQPSEPCFTGTDNTSELGPENEQNHEEVEADVVEEQNDVPSQAESHTSAVMTRRGKIVAYIRPDACDEIEPAFQCAKKITDIFESVTFEKEALTWKAMSLSKKNDYFEEFRKCFDWDEKDEVLRIGWEKKASAQYGRLLCRMRKKENIPPGMTTEVWISWTAYWDGEAFKKRSDKMKANRGRASTHTGGSRTFQNTGDVMRKIQKRVIPPHALFLETHTKNRDGKTFVSSKALAVEEAYQHEIELQSQEHAETGASIDENEAYYKASGGRKKSYIYGVGSSSTLYYGRGSSLLPGCRGKSSIDLQTEIDDLKEQLRVEREQGLLREEEIQLIRQRQSFFEQQLAMFTSARVSPSPRPENVDDSVDLTSPVTT